jgi:hypothetical protein
LTLGLLPIFRPRSQTLLRVFAHFGGPLGLFGVQGLKIKFFSGYIYLFGESPELRFYCGALAHFGGLLGFRGSKSNFISGTFTHR